MEMNLHPQQRRLREPQQIAGYAFETVETLYVEIRHQGFIGRGEANGLYYRGETATSMAAELEALRSRIEQCALSRAELQEALPAGGARNALDCALIELESHQLGLPVHALFGQPAPRPVQSSRTLYAGSPDVMSAEAKRLIAAPLLKLKLLGDGRDGDRLHAVRAERPEARLIVDANQGLNRAGYAALMPVLLACGVELIEQPFPSAHDDWLDGLLRDPRLLVAADESALTRAELPALRGRVDVINIKLDKAGGLTEAMAMAAEARALGFRLMVGCMCASSIAMAPAFLLAQQCDWADIDGPLYLDKDVRPALRYNPDAEVHWTAGTWGAEP